MHYIARIEIVDCGIWISARSEREETLKFCSVPHYKCLQHLFLKKGRFWLDRLDFWLELACSFDDMVVLKANLCILHSSLSLLTYYTTSLLCPLNTSTSELRPFLCCPNKVKAWGCHCGICSRCVLFVLADSHTSQANSMTDPGLKIFTYHTYLLTYLLILYLLFTRHFIFRPVYWWRIQPWF